jgi:hypothetical protein
VAFTDAQKAAIRRYLGYPDVFRFQHHVLEGTFTSVSPEAQDIAVGILDQLATLETSLQSAWSRQKVLKADTVVLAGADEIRALRAEGQRLAGDLSCLFGVGFYQGRSPFTQRGHGAGANVMGRG